MLQSEIPVQLSFAIVLLPLIAGLTFGILLPWRIELSLRRRKTIRGIYFRRMLLADQLIDLVTLAGMAIIAYSVSLIDFGLGTSDKLQMMSAAFIMATPILPWNELWQMRYSRYNIYKDEYGDEPKEPDTPTSLIANRSGLACGLTVTLALSMLRLSSHVLPSILFGLTLAPLYLVLAVITHYSKVALSNIWARRKRVGYPDTTTVLSSSPE